MSKSNLSLVATVLAIFGVAVTLGHPPWGFVTGAGFLLLAGSIGAGAIRTPADDYRFERRPAGQKISHGLVTLSSAAILAIYATGYHRTVPAAEKFEEQIAQRRPSAPIVAVTTTANLPPGLASVVVAPGGGASSPGISRSASPKRKTSDARSSTKSAPKQTLTPAAVLPPTMEPPATAADPPATTASNDQTPVPAADAASPNSNAKSTTYKDGTFLGWGYSRHGDIQAGVEIKLGKIVSTGITQCRTRYSCSVIVHLPGQVIERQSAAVDLVSGATESSDAFSDAVSEALKSAIE